MNKIEIPDVDELNQSIVDHVTSALNSFCLGEYKKGLRFPVVLGNIGYESLGIDTTYSIFYRIRKNKDEVLKYVDINIKNIKVRET